MSGSLDILGSSGLTASNTLKLGQDSIAYAQASMCNGRDKLSKRKKKRLYGNERWRIAELSKGSVAWFVSPVTSKKNKHEAFSSRLYEKLAQDTKFRAMYIIICKLFFRIYAERPKRT